MLFVKFFVQFVVKFFIAISLFFIIFANLSQAATLKIGTGAVYPPFVIKDEKGDLSGFEVELGKAVCREMKMECEFIQIAFQELFSSLKEKKIDFIMAALNITKDRLEEADAARAYMSSSGRFLKLKTNSLEFGTSNLKNKKVGAVDKSVYLKYISDLFANELEIKQYKSSKLMMEGLYSGEVDLIFSDELFLDSNFVKKADSVVEFIGSKIQDEKWFGEGMSAYFRKDNEQLKEKFNMAIRALRVRKEFQKISQKYFQRDIGNNN